MGWCLNLLSRASNPSSPFESTQSILPALPVALEKDEYAARFIFDKRNFINNGSEKGRVRPQAFKPECYQGNWETSVCRNTGVSEHRIWEISRTCRADKKALGRADVGISAVHAAGLTARAAPMLNYDEHAVVVGWHLTGEKDANMMLMVQLAAASDTRLVPLVE